MTRSTLTVDRELLERCRAVLRRHPAALLSDIDGTLSDIAPTPAEAMVAPEIRDSLERLAGSLALTGVISGRSTTTARQMVGAPDLLYIGNHGMERWQRQVWSEHPEAVRYAPAIAAALAEIASGLPNTPLADVVLLETKGLTGAIHYRLAPDVNAARAELLPLVSAAAGARELRVVEGRAVLELRPPVQLSKGTAVTELIEEFGLHGVIFIGDDVTDVDAFLALKQARQFGLVETLAIGVLSPETPALVLETMDVAAPGVTGVADLLAALADDYPALDA